MQVKRQLTSKIAYLFQEGISIIAWHFTSTIFVGIVTLMKKLLLPSALILLLLVTACKKSNLPPSYIGTWGNSSGAQLVLNTDNSYTLTNIDVLYASTGTYTVSDANIAFKDKAGSSCPDSIVGIYIYKYFIDSDKGNFHQHLRLTTQFDTCAARAGVAPGTYDLQ